MTTTIPPLASLCGRCRVLEFDDSAWPGAHQAGSEREGYYLDIPKETDLDDFELDYILVDSLPELPCLSDSGNKGCAFCVVLKKAIQKYARGCSDVVVVNLFYQRCRYNHQRSRPVGLKSLLARLLWLGSNEEGHDLSHSTWLHFGIDSPPDSCAQWLRLESSPRDDVLCPENLLMIHENLQNSSHIRPFTEGSVYPTRLIEVGDDASNTCRLVETGSNAAFLQSPHIPYAALSYCWGPPEDIVQQFKTEKSSLDSRLKGFKLHEVSPILRDAIIVSRALRIRYLWVDAVCIIQDDVEDWDRESSLMSLVFQNAALTICTPASTSCQQGFLARDWIMTRIQFKSNINGRISGSYIVRLVGEVSDTSDSAFGCLEFDLYYSHWASRGWVLQEYELSQRAVIFGQTKLHVVTEKGAQSETDKMTWSLPCTRGHRYLQQLEQDRLLGYEYWLNLVVRYSRGTLTHRTDKLPALSGLASRLLHWRASSFLAGHIILHIDLFWVAWLPPSRHLTRAALVDHLKSRDSYVAPSWSWASRNHRILFWDHLFLVFRIIVSGIREECDIIRAFTSLTGSNPFGGVKDGSLVIHTAAVPLSLHVEALGSVSPDRELRRANASGSYVAELNFDWNVFEEEEPFKELLLVLLGSYEADENLLRDPVRVRYDTLLKDEETEGKHTVKFALVDEWIVAGVSGRSRLDLSDGLGVYGVVPDLIHEHASEGGTAEAQGASHHFEDGMENATANENCDTEKGHPLDATDAHKEPSEKSTSPGQAESEPRKDDEERDAYGIIVHPASAPGKYIRVGVFYSTPRECGGMKYFRSQPKRTIEII
ncbi:HET-domain-containing protein [Hypoxylon sp. FL0543]|nr:HET-domain-containing protein [Hypoxylon sp. FL0543]